MTHWSRALYSYIYTINNVEPKRFGRKAGMEGLALVLPVIIFFWLETGVE
jgi:hypothetical protein